MLTNITVSCYPMLILGIGVGLFIVILIWVVVLLACFLSAHCNKNVGLYAIILASLVTLILFLIPKEEYQDDTVKVYDTLLIWRIVLVLFLAIVAIATSSITLISHLTERRAVERIKD